MTATEFIANNLNQFTEKELIKIHTAVWRKVQNSDSNLIKSIMPMLDTGELTDRLKAIKKVKDAKEINLMDAKNFVESVMEEI